MRSGYFAFVARSLEREILAIARVEQNVREKWDFILRTCDKSATCRSEGLHDNRRHR